MADLSQPVVVLDNGAHITHLVVRDLVHSSEAWLEDDDGMLGGFDFTDVLWKEGDDFYHTKSPLRMGNISLDALSGELVPRSHLFTPDNPNFIHAPNPLPENSHIKHPSLVGYDSNDPDCGRLMLDEIRACETIHARPHPNLAEYRGCISEGGYIVALCFRQYNSTLRQAVADSKELDYLAIVQDIRTGVEHLHSLGLVHNDINPANIMVDWNGRGVLIDYDSCRPNGEEFPMGGKQGTAEWAPDTTISERGNDSHGLEKVERWVRGQVAELITQAS
ncbi:hypothetical protein FRC10_010226 [Ceratobasidium sp. 414]|nr:hypothetical protein FRC10_010226 [Ceratobasidium sp. 414]